MPSHTFLTFFAVPYALRSVTRMFHAKCVFVYKILMVGWLFKNSTQGSVCQEATVWHFLPGWWLSIIPIIGGGWGGGEYY